MKKYYAPNIEDFHLYYECEVLHDIRLGGLNSGWLEEKVQSGRHLDMIINKLRDKEARTPILTKEQIESEGWKFEVFGFEDIFKETLPPNYEYSNQYPFEHWYKKGNFWLAHYMNNQIFR